MGLMNCLGLVGNLRFGFYWILEMIFCCVCVSFCLMDFGFCWWGCLFIVNSFFICIRDDRGNRCLVGLFIMMLMGCIMRWDRFLFYWIILKVCN